MARKGPEDGCQVVDEDHYQAFSDSNLNPCHYAESVAIDAPVHRRKHVI